MKKIVFMGTPDFAVESLDAILSAGYEVPAVVTVPDRQCGRGQKLTPSAVKSYAVEHGIKVLQPEKLRDVAFLEELSALDADIFVVVAFRMLPQVVWSMPRLGTFNLHASLLPQYRGAAPINWAIINGERLSGVTTFLLNERIDEGKILLQCSTEISDNDNAGTLHDRLASMGAVLVVETLNGLFDGTLTGKVQSEEVKLKPAPKIFKQDCAIDWQRSGVEICNLVRGLSPYPAATTEMIDEKGGRVSMKIFEARFEPLSTGCQPVSQSGCPCPGHEVGMLETDNKKSLKIVVRDGFVEILSLQISGRKRVSVEEFLRGYNVSSWKLAL